MQNNNLPTPKTIFVGSADAIREKHGGQILLFQQNRKVTMSHPHLPVTLQTEKNAWAGRPQYHPYRTISRQIHSKVLYRSLSKHSWIP